MKRLRPPGPRVRARAPRRASSSCRSASSGETSSDTQPSTPQVRSKTGRNRSAARVRSSCASSKKSASPDLPSSSAARGSRVVGGAALDRLIEDRRVRREPRHRQLVDVALQRAGREQVARDVVEPEALAEIVELLCRVHRVALRVDRFRGSGIASDRGWRTAVRVGGCRSTFAGDWPDFAPAARRVAPRRTAPRSAASTISCASATIACEVALVPEALRVDLVDVLGARRPRGEPAARGRSP